MSFMKNFKMSVKMILMLIFPIAGLLYFSISDIAVKSAAVSEMQALHGLSKLGQEAGALIHELQKERGMTNAFISSKGVKFSAELPGQRTETDKKITALKTFLNTIKISRFGAEIKGNMDSALGKLDKLAGLRSSVSSLSIPGGEAVKYYTDTIDTLIHVIDDIPTISANAEISNMASAYVNIVQEKEKAGVERALMSGVFNADKFEPELLVRVISTIAKQDAFHYVFLSFANAGQQEFYKGKMQGADVEETARMRKAALDRVKEGGFGIDSAQWFKAITGKINLLKEVEDKLSGDLVSKADQLKVKARTALIFYILLSLVILAVAVFFAVIISRDIQGSLSEAVTMLGLVAQGELSKSMTYDGKDEIGTLAGNLNRMIGSFSSIIRTVLQSSNSVSAKVELLKTRAENTAQNSKDQSLQAAHIATAAEEMSQTILDIARNASVASQTSAEAIGLAQKGSNVALGAIETVDRVHLSTVELADMIKKLGRSSAEIGDIVTVIKDIADQTNLLALNAAIEAARAGEQGRGFAVVADEVRALADRTIKATTAISDKINSVQAESIQTARSMDGASAEVTKANEYIRQLGSELQNIVESVQKVSDQITGIATAVDEQSAASEEVASNIEKTASIATSMEKMSGEVMQDVHSLSDVASDLKGSTSGFRI